VLLLPDSETVYILHYLCSFSEIVRFSLLRVDLPFRTSLHHVHVRAPNCRRVCLALLPMNFTEYMVYIEQLDLSAMKLGLD
jgi:hypothetical protein